ncbi:hypothetical protein TorRG33x02_343260 [Trema orientale]|uniref:DUF4283 domain-containing protein n=1 Tax=Trema orientale TaxID=63057 RepID=A0A2P5ARR0_TREOI|nr:hypothetical protein TorRG33x02_343260 [Trema orientale]
MLFTKYLRISLGLVLNMNTLFITEEEEGAIGIDEGIVSKGKEEILNGLLGKLLIHKPYNRNASKAIMELIWQVQKGLMICEVDRDIYLFSFTDASERQSVLNREPWNFDKSLLILKPLDDEADTGWDGYSLTHFWIQIYNLPLHGRVKEIADQIGNQVGMCMDVDTDEQGRCWGRFVRARVFIDVSKSMRRRA